MKKLLEENKTLKESETKKVYFGDDSLKKELSDLQEQLRITKKSRDDEEQLLHMRIQDLENTIEDLKIIPASTPNLIWGYLS